MDTRLIGFKERQSLITIQEDHFNDLKSKNIKPAKLQETFVAFANGDGGDIWIGIEDPKVVGDRMLGFNNREEANDILHTLLEETKPAVENVDIEFLELTHNSYILHISIPKSPKVHYCSSGDCYLRINASSIKIKGERITQLGYAKGNYPYEKVIVEIAQSEDYEDSLNLYDYLIRVNTDLEPGKFLRKQRLLSQEKDTKEWKPNVACVLLFDDEPQATLDTRCAIKVYRLLTTERDYKREQLQGEIITIDGHIESQIYQALKVVNDLLEDSSIIIDGNLEKFTYPNKTIHEILVNAVIHRDYSLNDDIHIKIFDNRIEILSPGKLPGYITTSNIYDERFSRNPNLVRLLHNLPNPVNHDIGEGLDTARNEMKRAGLVDPLIEELDNTVKITISHKKLASLEDVILTYLNNESERTITNKVVREISGEDDVNKVKKAFQKLRELKKIDVVDSAAKPFQYSYKLVLEHL